MRGTWLWLALWSGAVGAQEPVPVYNGDFELESDEAPPPGWVMWGAQAYKDPANYTRDTARPHSGQACFRIHHPTGTRGYIVSDPERALRPEPGRIYAVRFWARSDTPGESAFYFTAYETIRPYRDAPSPGRWTLATGTEWQEYRFEIREGLDFDANRSRYLLLTFTATADPELERTLWIDDVEVTSQVDPDPVRLPSRAGLAAPPLEHRLRPGERLEFTVDTSQPQGPATRMAGGISFHRVAGWTGQPYDKSGAYTLDPRVEAAIRELRLPMTRFYGVGDEPFEVEAAIDKVAELCGKVGIDPANVVLELETQSAERLLPPELWARAARHVLAKGYGFRYWEVANEPYSSLWGHGGAFPTPQDYVDHVVEVARAIRAVQPDAQIGVGVTNGVKWGDFVLARAAGSYDFVAHHYYIFLPEIERRKFEVVALTANYELLARVLTDNAYLAACNPGREVYQLDTEWGLHCSGPNGERADYQPRNADTWGMMHRAVRLIYYAREGLLRGAGSWQMLSAVRAPGFGILSQQAPDTPFLIYWLYHQFNRHVGELVAGLDGAAPWYTPAEGDDRVAQPGENGGPLTPVLATFDPGGPLYLVVANGSAERDVPCRALAPGFRGPIQATVLQAGLDAPPLVERVEEVLRPLTVEREGDALSFVAPAHGVVFVTVQRG